MSPAPVYLTAFTLFAGFSALFATRMVAGDDPALGIKPGYLATPAPAGVLHRVIVTRRVRVDGLTRAQIRRRGIRRVVVVRRQAAPVAEARALANGTGGAAVPAVAVTGGGEGPAAVEPSTTTPAAAPVAPSPVAPTTATPTPTPAPAAAAPVPAPTPAPAPAPVATTTS